MQNATNSHKFNDMKIDELQNKILELEKQIENLQQSNFLYQSIIQNLPLGLQIFDKNGLSYQLNEKQKEFLGLPNLDEGIGKFNVLTDPYSVAIGANKVYEKVYKGEIYQHEFEYNLGIDENKWNTVKEQKNFNETIIPIKKNEDVQFVVAVLNDMTGYRNAEKALKESEEKYRLLAENSTDVISLHDKNGFYTYISPSCKTLFGYDTDEILGKKTTEFIYPGDLENFLKEFFLQIEENNISRLEYRRLKKDGSFIWVENVSKIIRDNLTHEIINVICIIRDISERKKAEIIINNQNKELKQLNLDKDKFFKILAHDLRSPFNSILGFLELLTKNIRKYDIDKIENQINIVNNSAQSTFNLLEDILLWARANAGKIPYEPQKLNFETICNEVIVNLELTANAKDIKINHFSAEEIYFFADKNMINTVLRNLISNSIKFTNKNGRIDIYAETNHEIVTITISDNGIGIKPDILNKLFDISQTTTTNGTENEKGTGLGLLLCKEFVEKHNGKIWVESELGKGSDFKFTIPLSHE